jgi:hypothetical protein
MRYEFENVNDWLEYAVDKGSVTITDLLSLIRKYVDDDYVEMMFDDQMVADGYYVDLDDE